MKHELSERLNQVVASLSVGAFLAEFDEVGFHLTVHVKAGADLEQARREVIAATRLTGRAVEVRVVPHQLRHLAAPRSIEYWLKQFAGGTVIFDPTLVAGRARALLQAARAWRREFDGRITGIYFVPAQRTMCVVMPEAADAASALEYQRRLLAAISEGAATGDRWPFALRVTATMPRGELTPVDAASAPMYRRLARFIRRGLAPGAFALAVASLSLPAAANKPPQGVPGVIGAKAGMPAADVRYGVLWGLSVFADGQSLPAGGAFATSGLEKFFGEDHAGGDLVLRVAQSGNLDRPVRRTIIRDITDSSSESGPGGASPGS